MKEDKLIFIETKGLSMWPFMKGKEKLIALESLDNLKRGSLILYRKDNQIICHRFIKRKGNILFVCQDTSLKKEPIEKKAFVGRVIGIIKDKKIIDLQKKRYILLGYLISFLNPVLNLILKIYKILNKYESLYYRRSRSGT